MVHDSFKDQFKPYIGWPYQQQQGQWPVPDPEIAAKRKELDKLIAEYKEAIAAAKRVDVLTNQPDCEDPDKAKLQEFVAQLKESLSKL